MDDKELRKIEPKYSIDPGFINFRKCFSTFGNKFEKIFIRNSLPDGEHLNRLHNYHLLVDLVLQECALNNIKSLLALLHSPKVGEIFSSTHSIYGNNEVYTKERVKILMQIPGYSEKKVYLEFGIKHFLGDTIKSEFSMRSRITIIGELHSINENEIIIHPLIMGTPTLSYSGNDENIESSLWLSVNSWYQCYVEEIDEFKVVEKLADPLREEWLNYMGNISESKVKEFLCDILHELPVKDWGGEQADIYTASLHLNGRRLDTAFLLKGPSRFREMTMDMLGKRADQIYRLSCTPAKLLIVQHCHQIGEAVRANLKAFSETPGNPRYYCFIDGKDTYKLLKAFNKL